jgi:beta-glucosidase
MATLGHEKGVFAPGIRDRAVAVQVSHHLLLAHGLALRAIRSVDPGTPAGIVLNQAPVVPATDSPEDRRAAQLEDGQLVRWYMDPLFRGAYPADVLEVLGAIAPRVAPGDLETINQPLDFLGINYYTRNVASADQSYVAGSEGHALTDMGWEIEPKGLSDLLLRLHRDYRLPPLYVTENGAAFRDVLVGHRVADAERVCYLRDHLAAVADAREQGVDVRGYFVWSLLDNFEWADGYSKRFGIVHVDYATQRRTLKDSAHWYAALCDEARRLAARARG